MTTVSTRAPLPYLSLPARVFRWVASSTTSGYPPLAQVPVAERGHVGVQLGADPGDLGFGDPQRGYQVVNLAGRHAVHAGLHHRGVHRDIGTHRIRINGTNCEVGNNRLTAECARQSSSNSRM
jgi:hypothetical protein